MIHNSPVPLGSEPHITGTLLSNIKIFIPGDSQLFTDIGVCLVVIFNNIIFTTEPQVPTAVFKERVDQFILVRPADGFKDILAGIVATVLGEQLGYGAGVLYFYGLFGHNFVAGRLEKRIK